MRWLGLLCLIWLQASCAPREVRCEGTLRPINANVPASAGPSPSRPGPKS
jgi:hypothetical protein